MSSSPHHLPFSGPDARRALDEIVVELQSVRELRNRLDAREAALLERASRVAESEAATMPNGGERELAHRTVNAELGAAVQLSDRAVERRVAQSVCLVREYPRVQRALAQGAIDRARAMAVCEAGVIVHGREARERYESEALEYAASESVNRVRPHVARLAERYAERTIDERHARALEERRVTISPLADGMALLQAVLSAREAKLVHARLTQCARELRATSFAAEEAGEEPPADPRTVDQKRADVLVDIVTGWDPDSGGVQSDPPVRVKVQVTAPVACLGGGADEGPGVLAGHGPIASADVRWFAGVAEHWDVVSTHPRTGEVLQVDRYRPSERMRRRLAARDAHCRFPGCRVPIVSCDLDHTVDHARGGRTATDNLAHLCRWHHTLKHHSPWRVEQHPDGVLAWTSPTGRTYRDRPVSRVAFRAAPPGPGREPGSEPDPPREGQPGAGAHPF